MTTAATEAGSEFTVSTGANDYRAWTATGSRESEAAQATDGAGRQRRRRWRKRGS